MDNRKITGREFIHEFDSRLKRMFQFLNNQDSYILEARLKGCKSNLKKWGKFDSRYCSELISIAMIKDILKERKSNQ